MIEHLRALPRMTAAALASGALYVGVTAETRLLHADQARRDAYVRTWARVILGSLRVEISRDPPGPRPHEIFAQTPRLVVSNHRSMVDILVMLDLFGGELLARGDMADWPFIGEMARTAGTLFVDRKDPGSGAGAIQRIRDRLRLGRTIGLFPEGTTFGDDEVRPFHGGAFIAASRAKAEVVPVGLAYADPASIFGDEPFGAHAKRLILADRTRVAVAIGEPISSEGRTSTALRDEAHAAVQRLVGRARALLR